MRIIFLFMLILAIGCQKSKKQSNQAVNGSASSVKQSTTELISQKVREYIKSNFPDFVFPDTSEYHNAWWSFYSREQVPYFTITDINDDSKEDYGLLLKNSCSLNLIILVDSGGTYKHWIFSDFSETYTGEKIIFGVGVEAPGRTDRVVKARNQSLVLKSNGIVLNNFEFKSRIYYWNNGEIKVFRVADRIFI